MRRHRHHNTKGYRQIARGKTRGQVRRIAERLGIRYGGVMGGGIMPNNESGIDCSLPSVVKELTEQVLTTRHSAPARTAKEMA